MKKEDENRGGSLDQEWFNQVNEVSYMVGINKPSYFAALFKKQFGVLPKDYITKPTNKSYPQ